MVKLFVVIMFFLSTRIVFVPPSIVCRHQTVFNLRLKPFIFPTTQTEAARAAVTIKPHFFSNLRKINQKQIMEQKTVSICQVCVKGCSMSLPQAIRYIWTTHIFPACLARLLVDQPLIIPAGEKFQILVKKNRIVCDIYRIPIKTNS